MIGSKGEYSYNQNIFLKCTHSNRLFNLAGQTNAKQLLALLEQATLFISNDSGPAHLAAGYETPAITLFGPETPIIYGPLNPNITIIKKDIYCSPCISVYNNKKHSRCTNAQCMSAITTDEVLSLINEKIKHSLHSVKEAI
jgi:ADP-heptose:LPS heptosyltransferase